MIFSSLVTICITIGRRPEELRRTLDSIGPELRALPILAVNDFGDEETNDVFREMCPHGRIILKRGPPGHTRAVDLLYGMVQTPFIFHLEDDWIFTRTDFVQDALTLLSHDEKATSVGFRDLSDLRIKNKDRDKIIRMTTNGIANLRLDQTSDKWFGYTFNPHISRRTTWLNVGGFSQFRGEMHISRQFRNEGRYCLFLDPGPCHHGGEGVSVRKAMKNTPAENHQE